MFASGRCLCGAVSFTVSAPPLRMAQCHCEQCRRSTGTGHIMQAFFTLEDVTIDGEMSVYHSVADSGSQRRRWFCPACGARLFSDNSRRPELIAIAAGAFDNSDWFKPQAVVYTAQRPVWDVVDAAIPAFAGPQQ